MSSNKLSSYLNVSFWVLYILNHYYNGKICTKICSHCKIIIRNFTIYHFSSLIDWNAKHEITPFPIFHLKLTSLPIQRKCSKDIALGFFFAVQFVNSYSSQIPKEYHFHLSLTERRKKFNKVLMFCFFFFSF